MLLKSQVKSFVSRGPEKIACLAKLRSEFGELKNAVELPLSKSNNLKNDQASHTSKPCNASALGLRQSMLCNGRCEVAKARRPPKVTELGRKYDLSIAELPKDSKYSQVAGELIPSSNLSLLSSSVLSNGKWLKAFRRPSAISMFHHVCPFLCLCLGIGRCLEQN